MEVNRPVVTRTGIVIGGAHQHRRAVPYRTPSGLLIGAAYTPPANGMSEDAERLQALLLSRPVSLSACTMNRCNGGRATCPSPDACELPEHDAPRVVRWLAWLLGR